MRVAGDLLAKHDRRALAIAGQAARRAARSSAWLIAVVLALLSTSEGWARDVAAPTNAPAASALAGPPGAITSALTIAVPADAATLQDAVNLINARSINGNPTIRIQLADGVYGSDANPLRQIFINDAKFGFVQVLGNCAEPDKVTLNFDARDNLSGFLASHGGRIGLIDCVRIKGVGARLGPSTWRDQSFGSGVSAKGSGSVVTIGPKVTIDDFYYGVAAFKGASIAGQGVVVNRSGDANFIAGFGAVLTCLRCRGSEAGHRFVNAQGAPEALGFNFMAEMGSTLYVDDSVGLGADVASIAAQTNGAAWAHGYTGSGSAGAGARIVQNGFIELGRARLSENGVGIVVSSGGGANLDGARIVSNVGDGILADGGRVYGSAVTVQDNGRHGIRVTKQGRAELYGSASTIGRNGAGDYRVDPISGCRASTDPCSPAGTLIVD